MADKTTKPKSTNGTMSWRQWLGASGAAGGVGTFAFVTYMHAAFPSLEQFKQHKEQPHKGVVAIEQYRVDMNRIQTNLEKTNKNLKETNTQLQKLIGKLGQ